MIGRWGVAVAASASAALLVRSVLRVLHLPFVADVVVALLLVAATAALARRLPPALDTALREHRVLAALWALVAVLTMFQVARLGDFTADPSDVNSSAIPIADYAQHNCLTAYVRAGELSRDDVADVYDPDHYAHAKMAGFDVDRFQYPPPFLLLPRLGLSLSSDFLTLRAFWLLLAAAIFVIAVVSLARWLGGNAGLTVGLLLALLLSSPPILLTLQIGNFHLAAFSLAVLGMLALERGHRAPGSALLAFAIASKLFPAILLLHLAFRRRWRDVGWTLGAIGALMVVSLAVVGPGVFAAFFAEQLPRLASGEAFSFLAIPGVAAVNHSVPGIVLKLDPGGIEISSWVVRAVALTYAAVLIAIASWAARGKRTPRGHAQTWLALLHLAALASPFVPQDYALVGPLWLLAVIAPGCGTRPVRWGLFSLAWIALAIVVPPALVSPRTLVLAVSASQILGITLCIWALVTSRAVR